MNFKLFSKQDRESPRLGLGGDQLTHFVTRQCHKVTRSNKEQNQVLRAEYTSPPPGARPSGSRSACGSLSRIFKPECVREDHG